MESTLIPLRVVERPLIGVMAYVLGTQKLTMLPIMGFSSQAGVFSVVVPLWQLENRAIKHLLDGILPAMNDASSPDKHSR